MIRPFLYDFWFSKNDRYFTGTGKCPTDRGYSAELLKGELEEKDTVQMDFDGGEITVTSKGHRLQHVS
jgi:hypothetical protein